MLSISVLLIGWVILSIRRSYQLYRFVARLRDIDYQVNTTEISVGISPMYSISRAYQDGSLGYLYWKMWVDVDVIADFETIRAQTYVKTIRDAYENLSRTESVSH